MAPRPDKIDWGNSNIQEPTDPKKTTGFNIQEKPPRNYFNWFWNLVSLIQFYVFGQSQEWIIISSDADEGDYATLAAYIADSPAVGDKVLVKETQVLTAQMTIPDEITLRILDGAIFTRSTLEATSAIKLGNTIIIEGVLFLALEHTGTTATAVELNGSFTRGNIFVQNSSTGTITNAFLLNAGKEGNHIIGSSLNSVSGTITNAFVDNSGNDSNNVLVSDVQGDVIVRSDGAKAFRNGLEFDLGSDANGDIYYRDAGILKRLPKGSDGESLVLASGIPAWQAQVEPVASVVGWPASSPPSGWLECNGASLDTTTYSGLFAVIGYTYGGSGSNFNIPNYRGEFLRGWDHAAGTDPDAATRTDRGDTTTGDNVGTKQAWQFQSHQHTLTAVAQLLTRTAGGDGNFWEGTAGGVVGATGGNQTNPTNVNIMQIIKY